MSTRWDAQTYDVSSQPQQAWAADVLERLRGIAPDATALDVGCGTGRVTEQLLELVPRGRVLAFDASPDMVELARVRLGDRAEVFCQDVLSLELSEPVDVVVSNAVLHWVTDHPRMWTALAAATTGWPAGGSVRRSREHRSGQGGDRPSSVRRIPGAGGLVAVGVRCFRSHRAAAAERGLP